LKLRYLTLEAVVHELRSKTGLETASNVLHKLVAATFDPVVILSHDFDHDAKIAPKSTSSLHKVGFP
jgi:hypothetical protein